MSSIQLFLRKIMKAFHQQHCEIIYIHYIIAKRAIWVRMLNCWMLFHYGACNHGFELHYSLNTRIQYFVPLLGSSLLCKSGFIFIVISFIHSHCPYTKPKIGLRDVHWTSICVALFFSRFVLMSVVLFLSMVFTLFYSSLVFSQSLFYYSMLFSQSLS